MRSSLVSFATAGLLLQTLSCGTQTPKGELSTLNTTNQGTSSTVQTTTAEQLAYLAWCEQNQLDCLEQPTPPAGLQPSTWRALADIGEALLSDSYGLKITREDLLAEELLTVWDLFDARESYLELWEQQVLLNAFSGLQISGGFIKLAYDQNQRYFSSSGLNWNWEREVSVSFGESQEALLQGVSLGSEQQENLRSWQPEDTGLSSIGLGQSARVIDIPQNFWLREWGFELLPEPSEDSIDLSRVIRGASLLLPWLLDQNEALGIQAPVFQALARQLPTLVELSRAAQKRRALILGLRALIASVDQVVIDSRAQDQGQALVEVRFQKDTPSCTTQIPGTPSVSFRMSRPLQVWRIDTQNDGSIRFELSGLEGKLDLPGPFDPSLSLNRFVLGTEGITLLDVPILGQITVSYERMQSSNTRIRCA